jgi:hypothetical protein
VGEPLSAPKSCNPQVSAGLLSTPIILKRVETSAFAHCMPPFFQKPVGAAQPDADV